ncbi:MAG TPA: BON domain-containing protein [Gammaproteobacteria bacterium]|nr:BON domain-containing protein [Gammaproteobacteria bacterium]
MMKPNALATRAIILGLLALMLGGCGAVVIGGAVATANVAHDRRTAGTLVEDQKILLEAISMRDADDALKKQANVGIDVFNLQVLLTGQAENFEVVEAFRQRVAGIQRVRAVFNEVTVGAESTWSEATADAYLTARVKVALFNVKIDGFDPTRVTVTSSQGSVYLMGLLTPTEADAVTEEVRFVSGVKRVVKLFEYIDR